MSIFNMKKPRLPSHYYIRFEPPDSSGDEVLFFTSERRNIKLKGRSFREFLQVVVPILDGQHTLEEIEAEVSAQFSPNDLEQCLQLLAEHNLLRDSDQDILPADLRTQLEPQLNFFHELNVSPYETQKRLMNATVAVIGMGGAGASVALSLAAAYVGTIRCIDSLAVAPSDPYLAPTFTREEIGMSRVEIISKRIAAISPRVKVVAHVDPLETDADVIEAIEGSDFVVGCVDAGLTSLFYKLNRACLQLRIPWTSCAVSALESIVGPTIYPFETACYLCYKMRMVACVENPEDEFSFQRFLDRRKQDDSGKRENLVFAVGSIGNLVGLEVLKTLTGVVAPSALGRIVVVDVLNLTCTKHLVLRKPWCPACFSPDRGTASP